MKQYKNSCQILCQNTRVYREAMLNNIAELKDKLSIKVMNKQIKLMTKDISASKGT